MSQMWRARPHLTRTRRRRGTRGRRRRARRRRCRSRRSGARARGAAAGRRRGGAGAGRATAAPRRRACGGWERDGCAHIRASLVPWQPYTPGASFSCRQCAAAAPRGCCGRNYWVRSRLRVRRHLDQGSRCGEAPCGVAASESETRLADFTVLHGQESRAGKGGSPGHAAGHASLLARASAHVRPAARGAGSLAAPVTDRFVSVLVEAGGRPAAPCPASPEPALRARRPARGARSGAEKPA